MEATGRKRKGSHATPSTTEGNASKKLKLLNSPRNNVQEVGLRLVEQLKKATDKNGRLIATEFIQLPDRAEVPDYYEVTRLPVSIDTVEVKLRRNEFPTIAAVESDFKRMVANAKAYNQSGSVIWEDAERIRRHFTTFMKRNNPAYKRKGYTPFPTPIPDEDTGSEQNGQGRQKSETVERVATASPKPSDKKSSVAPSTATGDADEGVEQPESPHVDLDLQGLAFQEAQEMIVAHLLHFADAGGLEMYTPFVNLPSRKLEDYHKLIRHPVSLKLVQKRIRGIHGRATPTGVTDFKTWDAFGQEMSFIWRNAQEYNEDGSEMYNLAEQFKEHLQKVLQEAKDKVEEPSGPKLKIGGPKPKVMLNLTQRRASSVASQGVTVDNDALARQRQAVQAGVDGQQTQARRTPVGNGVVAEVARPPSVARSGSSSTPAVNGEVRLTHSPAPGPAPPAPTVQQASTNGSMAPPPSTFRPSTSHSHHSPAPYQAPTYSAPIVMPPTNFRTYPLEEALLPAVTVSTHPQLKIPAPLSVSIAPHALLSHHSTTLTLPGSHFLLQISPTISNSLSLGRAYKLFVTVNGIRLTQRDTQLAPDTGRRTHVYEGSLAQGVNRIEVEVAAARVGEEKGLDVEKVTVFANLMRA